MINNRYHIFIPGGIVSLCVLPIIFYFYIQSVTHNSIELNGLSIDTVYTKYFTNRSIIQKDSKVSVDDIISLSNRIKFNSDTLSYYQISLANVNKYGDLIMILDAFQNNKLSFFVSDSVLFAWLMTSDNNYYQLSHYDEPVIANPVTCGLFPIKYTMWEELAMKSWREIVHDRLFQVTTIIITGWLLLFVFSIRNAIQMVNSRRLTSGSN